MRNELPSSGNGSNIFSGPNGRPLSGGNPGLANIGQPSGPNRTNIDFDDSDFQEPPLGAASTNIHPGPTTSVPNIGLFPNNFNIGQIIQALLQQGRPTESILPPGKKSELPPIPISDVPFKNPNPGPVKEVTPPGGGNPGPEVLPQILMKLFMPMMIQSMMQQMFGGQR